MLSLRNRFALFGLGTSVVLLASGLVASPAVAVPVPAQIASEEPAPTELETDEAIAMSAAIAEGHGVVVDSLTTETTQVVAKPDGTYELTADAVPVRVLQGGEWVDIDTTLVSGDSGWLSPVASAVPVRFSGGGSSELVQVQLDDGSWLVETWPLGDLPSPQVVEASATYLDVLPDVDLRLTATADGMSEVFIIHSAEAAQNPDLLSLKLGIEGAAVFQQADGLTAVVPEGEPSEGAQTADLRSNAPNAWDSSEAESGPEGPGGMELAEQIPVEASDEGLTLDVDAVVDAEVTYPLYVDPDWTGGKLHAWYIDQTYPNQAYVDGGAWTDGDQQMGFIAGAYSADGLNQLVRAFWQMPTSALAGKTILAAAFNTTLVWGFNCTPSPMELWRVDGAPVGGTWNSTAGASWAQYLDGKNVAAGRSGCPAAGVGFNVQAGVAAVAAASGASITLGMRASNEGSSTGWKRWAVGASLVVSYNSTPKTPTSLKLASPARGCGTASAPAWVNGTALIKLQATFADADPGNVAGRFYVVDGTNLSTNKLPSALAPSGYLQSATQAQGAQSVTLPANTLSPGLHAWRATTWDGSLSSPSSAWCYIQVKNAPPALPTILSRDPGPYKVGQPTGVRFASDPADEVVMFAIWWSYSTSTSPSPPIPVSTEGAPSPCTSAGTKSVRYVCASADGTTPLVTVAPVASSAVLWVASIDRAGNVSVSGGNTATAVAYTGTNAAVADTTRVSYSSGHGWPTVDLSSPLGSTIADANTNSGTSLTSSKPLSLSALVSKTVTAAPLAGNPAIPVFDTPNLIALNRYYNPTTSLHYEMTSAPPAGFQYEMILGWIVPPIGPGQTQPTGTSALYRCLINGDQDFLTTSATCEGRGNGPILLGYRWNSAPTLPPGTTAGGLTLCNVGDETATPDYDANCAAKWSLGFTILAGASEASGPAVDTTKSFTVSAWLKPGNLAGRAATALSQSGASNSGFGLKVGANGHWQFCLQAQVGTTAATCVEGATAVAGQWQFVTGTWDTNNRQLRLYLGDTNEPDAVAWRKPVTDDTTATGKVMLAGLGVGGAPTEAWFGQIASPTIFPGVADQLQRQNLYYQYPPN